MINILLLYPLLVSGSRLFYGKQIRPAKELSVQLSSPEESCGEYHTPRKARTHHRGGKRDFTGDDTSPAALGHGCKAVLAADEQQQERKGRNYRYAPEQGRKCGHMVPLLPVPAK